MQWAVKDGGGAFVPCGETVKTVGPGFYDVVDVGFGQYGLTGKSIVSDELIDIPGTIADDLFVDVDKFLSSKDRYHSYSLTHKRGVLLWGPPGSGKTSLAVMLGKRFVDRVGGVVIFAASSGAFIQGVELIREVEPGRPSMYLLEEADRIVNNTTCLSILDGELSIEGAVFVAMTNYLDKLPPRISNRPGRFDRVEKVDCPPRPVQVEYLRRVEARVGDDPTAPERIVDALVGLQLSLAHLREAFICHKLMGLDLAALRERFEVMIENASESGETEKFMAKAVAEYDALDALNEFGS